ncbi:MAG: nucleoside triphosphate pyrophosphohydrolase family protein [Roseibium sp.]|uniref:nucleoside triphosphate pyrophosphohydrolase family protein n=1 Tax=Alphaproteobacteria TaxID=28211 RepID=UPI0029434D4E|nr:nucleoside triphosphate pyrophosphohydrolase family protein [Sulfitobacter sp. LC.270.F.C4]WOI13261.1 nucleoside triphosphate pyrophosphohydrolase family protein [Sulfitobacter sp. LC.270.F.C4]
MQTIKKYQLLASSTDHLSDRGRDLSLPLLGLFGEIGSLLSEAKKKQRDPVAYLGYERTVLEEFGDVLWYLAAVATRSEISIADLALQTGSTSPRNTEAKSDTITFADLQEPDAQISWIPQPTAEFERTLIRLSAEVGLLMVDYDAGRFVNNQPALVGRLLSVLRALLEAAGDAGITLEAAAKGNLIKIKDRWPDEKIYPAPFDDGFPEQERFERRMVFEIKEVLEGDLLVSRLTKDGIAIGDVLTDNRQGDDDYRFHDVFHMAYAAVMGWSPTLRRLLKRKRKSDPMIDETQDGARAVLIEEGIATWIFNHAQRLEYFENLHALDYSMLKNVREFVQGYESENCPLWCWEEAILQGYAAFRQVKKNRSGRLIVDLNNHTLQYEQVK